MNGISRKIRERVVRVVDRYIVTGHPIRKIAEHFHVSKSTIGVDLLRAYYIVDGATYEKLQQRIESNLAEHRKYGHTINYQDYPPDIVYGNEDTYGAPMKDFYEEEPEI